MMHWSAKYVGLPWCEHGRDRDGIDCWGLLVLAFAAERGISLPSYAEGYTSVRELQEISGLMQNTRSWPWKPVEVGQEREWDMAVFRRAGIECHVGLVIERGRMLHVAPREDSCLVDYRDGRYAPRLAGFYRHSALMVAHV